MNNLLNDSVCLITGAGKGFGRDLVLKYINQGAKLGLITRNQEDIDCLKCLIPSGMINRCLFICGDVSDEDISKNFVLECYKYFGRIDVLINNAGMRFRKPFLEISASDFRTVIENNFFSMVFLCQAVLPYMVASKKGKIINMSSVAGTLGLADLSAYVSSKSAIVGLTKSLAIEFAESNIQVNAIAPGFAKTSYFESFKENKELYDFTINRIPMNRWGESEEIVNVCLFLSSNLSNYVTGEVIAVDGGWSAW